MSKASEDFKATPEAEMMGRVTHLAAKVGMWMDEPLETRRIKLMQDVYDLAESLQSAASDWLTENWPK